MNQWVGFGRSDSESLSLCFLSASGCVRVVGGLRLGVLQSDGGLAGGEGPAVVGHGPPGGGDAPAGISGGQV